LSIIPYRASLSFAGMDSKQDLPIISFASQGDWEQWLHAQHAKAKGLWLKLAKKGSSIDSVTYKEALQSALCYGWIDGQKGSFDEQYWLQRFTPRGPRSKWSKINRDKATELLAQDRMQPAGLEQVLKAQQDGRWDAAYEGQRTATAPDDLQRELDCNPEAKAFFATLDSANRYAILYRLQDAKKPETRARRLAKYIVMLSEQEKLHP
jgi:uncharacterized protein YdeI (YjbR/CyaY-like superfamily)